MIIARNGRPVARLRPGASPYDIRTALFPEDRAGFDADYARALADAGGSLDLTDLFTTLERWRRLAVMRSDPENFRHAVRQAAALLTGEAVPADEPLSATRPRLASSVPGRVQVRLDRLITAGP